MIAESIALRNAYKSTSGIASEFVFCFGAAGRNGKPSRNRYETIRYGSPRRHEVRGDEFLLNGLFFAHLNSRYQFFS